MQWWMYIFLLIYAVASLVLIMVILLQSGKGGGLSSLGASNQGIAEALGATGAERTLTRLTTYCAVAFITLALVISVLSSRGFNRSSKNIIGATSPAAATLPQTGSLPTTAGAAGNAPAPKGSAPAASVPVESVPVSPAPAAPVAPVPAAPAPAAPAPAQ
jgi:protein translocase SecG subunit